MKKLIILPIIFLSGCSFPQRDLKVFTYSEPTATKWKRWSVEIESKQDFAAEADYVRTRRVAAGAGEIDGFVGLAFSGGGLRSATINLGVLQELQNQGLLKEADYLSCVSGGAYIGAWYVSHLTAKPGGRTFRDAANFEYTSNPGELLASFPFGPVDKLRDRRGFVFGKNNWRIPLIGGIWGATIPVNAVFDVGLHFKPTRGKFNLHHPNHYYDLCIRQTYLRPPAIEIPGQEVNTSFFKGLPHSIRLNEINPKGSPAPYLIVNSALANSRPGSELAEALPFEFSRFACGSGPLGYVPAKHFGYPVEGTFQDGGKRFSVMRSNSTAFLPVTKPFALSTAVAASGAALDSNGINTIVADEAPQKGPEFNAPVVKTARMYWDFVLKPLNLNLRHQNRNFAMAITRNSETDKGTERQIQDWQQPAHDVEDRAREVTKDRFNSSVFSNSLYLSDGAHYENLGIFALVQRPEMKEIWAFDAGGDGKYEFSDIAHSQKLLEKAGWRVVWDKNIAPGCAKLADMQTIKGTSVWDRSPVFRAKLTRFKRTIDLYYVKSSYRRGDGVDNSAREMLMRFRYGAEGSRAHDNFPHTSTLNLSFRKIDFDAYREIGRVLASELKQARR